MPIEERGMDEISFYKQISDDLHYLGRIEKKRRDFKGHRRFSPRETCKPAQSYSHNLLIAQQTRY